MEPLLFYQQRKHTIRQIFIAIAVLFVSGSMMFFLPGILCYVFFGFLFFLGTYGLLRLALRKPTVTVTDEGIKSSGNGMGFIPWEFITGFEIKEGINFTAIVIMITHQERFFEDKTSIVTKIMRVNVKRFGTPIVLSESLFHIPLEKVKTHLEDFYGYKNPY
ncbi:STM3941 family protein [uncultured Kordia sp.]|uniref:STM3941 family protein n=1 Tax=uncultured Kordia sp. TaxID=507699 RepID=UPI00260AA85E|nr:STM3941 family protein [uncultured Kordia sp.]